MQGKGNGMKNGMKENDLQNACEEQEFLEKYDITKYERPSIAADIAAFSILGEGESHNFRKLPEKALKLLLIQRASYPYKDCWALPGGFCQPGEDVADTARRELYEETNINNADLRLVGIFGETGRDPRGWIISNTFLALMNGEKCRLRADTDAWAAEWFSVGIAREVLQKECTKESARIQTMYRISLECGDSGIKLSATVKEDKRFQDFHEKVWYEIMDSDGLAFDHAKIILHALLSLQKLAEENVMAVFHFLPEQFTLTELQNAMELVQGRKLLTANFRRKIADYVVETEKLSEGAGHRPAKLFERNVETFYQGGCDG